MRCLLAWAWIEGTMKKSGISFQALWYSGIHLLRGMEKYETGGVRFWEAAKSGSALLPLSLLALKQLLCQENTGYCSSLPSANHPYFVISQAGLLSCVSFPEDIQLWKMDRGSGVKGFKWPHTILSSEAHFMSSYAYKERFACNVFLVQCVLYNVWCGKDQSTFLWHFVRNTQTEWVWCLRQDFLFFEASYRHFKLGWLWIQSYL